MQYDCNVVFYIAINAFWSTKTYGKSFDCNLRMQEDGNLVLYGAFDINNYWSSGSYCKSYNCVMLSIFHVQKDCNLLISKDGTPNIPTWQSGLTCKL
ncbi:hypothetical protein SELMODRAFT_78138 [Selaginella moellendorffii]|uniref:Bulb-type lectin domain-containing protein n=1 Tax=Selaginella moellendorffii TaxID=88036 RepID=D8QV88_SELML|nr:hypothetical protein SELMODRAFT_135924 [Selaginella moellendorffii]EFJ36011.1 hypothetical protein SELMODRAFT_78138 [Selaginella moellendorffii]